MRISAATGLQGDILLPGDKSISHRAIIFAAIAKGQTRIKGLLESEDCLKTVKAFQAMGVNIQQESNGDYLIVGVGPDGLQEPESIIDCGNSGTTMRLLTGLLSAQDFYVVLTGDDSLRQRPMARVIDPLESMGARIWARKHNYAPLSIQGQSLKGIQYRLPVASAQVKTALLLAGLYARGTVVIKEPLPSRDHTEKMLTAFGVKLDINREERLIALPEGGINQLTGQDVFIPADFSSAAYFIAAALITGESSLKISNVGLNRTRSGLLEVLKEMGARIELQKEKISQGEPVADIIVYNSQLKALTVAGEIIPRLIDEIPILAVIATQAEGRTVIRDAGELRVKESDRIKTMAVELSKLGASIEELPDGLIINGPVNLKGGVQVDSHGDHRVAMSLAIAGLIASGPVEISNSQVIFTSFPNFEELLLTTLKE